MSLCDVGTSEASRFDSIRESLSDSIRFEIRKVIRKIFESFLLKIKPKIFFNQCYFYCQLKFFSFLQDSNHQNIKIMSCFNWKSLIVFKMKVKRENLFCLFPSHVLSNKTIVLYTSIWIKYWLKGQYHASRNTN